MLEALDKGHPLDNGIPTLRTHGPSSLHHHYKQVLMNEWQL